MKQTKEIVRNKVLVIFTFLWCANIAFAESTVDQSFSSVEKSLAAGDFKGASQAIEAMVRGLRAEPESVPQWVTAAEKALVAETAPQLIRLPALKQAVKLAANAQLDAAYLASLAQHLWHGGILAASDRLNVLNAWMVDPDLVKRNRVLWPGLQQQLSATFAQLPPRKENALLLQFYYWQRAALQVDKDFNASDALTGAFLQRCRAVKEAGWPIGYDWILLVGSETNAAQAFIRDGMLLQKSMQPPTLLIQRLQSTAPGNDNGSSLGLLEYLQSENPTLATLRQLALKQPSSDGEAMELINHAISAMTDVDHDRLGVLLLAITAHPAIYAKAISSEQETKLLSGYVHKNPRVRIAAWNLAGLVLTPEAWAGASAAHADALLEGLGFHGAEPALEKSIPVMACLAAMVAGDPPILQGERRGQIASLTRHGVNWRGMQTKGLLAHLLYRSQSESGKTFAQLGVQKALFQHSKHVPGHMWPSLPGVPDGKALAAVQKDSMGTLLYPIVYAEWAGGREWLQEQLAQDPTRAELIMRVFADVPYDDAQWLAAIPAVATALANGVHALVERIGDKPLSPNDPPLPAILLRWSQVDPGACGMFVKNLPQSVKINRLDHWLLPVALHMNAAERYQNLEEGLTETPAIAGVFAWVRATIQQQNSVFPMADWLTVIQSKQAPALFDLMYNCAPFMVEHFTHIAHPHVACPTQASRITDHWIPWANLVAKLRAWNETHQ